MNESEILGEHRGPILSYLLMDDQLDEGNREALPQARITANPNVVSGNWEVKGIDAEPSKNGASRKRKFSVEAGKALDTVGSESSSSGEVPTVTAEVACNVVACSAEVDGHEATPSVDLDPTPTSPPVGSGRASEFSPSDFWDLLKCAGYETW